MKEHQKAKTNSIFSIHNTRYNQPRGILERELKQLPGIPAGEMSSIANAASKEFDPTKTSTENIRMQLQRLREDPNAPI